MCSQQELPHEVLLKIRFWSQLNSQQLKTNEQICYRENRSSPPKVAIRGQCSINRRAQLFPKQHNDFLLKVKQLAELIWILHEFILETGQEQLRGCECFCLYAWIVLSATKLERLSWLSSQMISCLLAVGTVCHLYVVVMWDKISDF